MRLNTRRVTPLDQARSCLEGNEPVDYHPLNCGGAHEFVCATLDTFGYQGLADEGTIRRYLEKFFGLSLPQIECLFRRHRDMGRVKDLRVGNSGRDFPRIYQPTDVLCWPRTTRPTGKGKNGHRVKVL